MEKWAFLSLAFYYAPSLHTVELIPPKYFVAFAFALIFIGTDDLSH